MGDRGNIVVLHRRGDEIRPIYLYTHWGGHAIEEIAIAALSSPEGRNRIGDPSYLTRIIFDHMTRGVLGETGYGIGPWPDDNEYDFVVVDPWTGQVYVVDGMASPEWLIEHYADQPPVWTVDRSIDSG